MDNERYQEDDLQTDEEQVVEVPVEQEVVVEGEEQEKSNLTHDLSDLLEVPQEDDNDMYIDDLFEADEEDIEFDDDLSDLTSVSHEDVMGRRPVKKKKVRYVRVRKVYREQPPTSLQGLR